VDSVWCEVLSQSSAHGISVITKKVTANNVAINCFSFFTGAKVSKKSYKQNIACNFKEAPYNLIKMTYTKY
jgi:hypothetical protein